jgi:luciferase-like monooxygenase
VARDGGLLVLIQWRPGELDRWEVGVGVSGAAEKIAAAMGALGGVVAQPHRFGGIEYRLARREIGHVHGDHLVDIPFTKKIREELVAAGKAERHHILPESGWVSVYLRKTPDVDRAIDLLRFSFEIAVGTIKKL